MPILRMIKSIFQRRKVIPKTMLSVITVLVVSEDWENIAVKYIIAIVVIRKKSFFNKYFFYLYYPTHLIIIFFISLI